MKKIILLILITLFSVDANAQDNTGKYTEVDYEKICSEVNNPASTYYLPKLMDRFSNFDTTLQYNEYFYLYFGYSCSDKYSPYPISQYDDSLKYYFKSLEDKSELNRKVLEFCPKIFIDLPFEMKYYEFYAMANIYNGDTAKAVRIFKCTSGIYDAIMSTGDGKTEATAYKVINVENEYELIRFLDMEPSFEQSLTKSICDRLGIKPNNFNISEMFFDVKRLFEKSPLRNK